MRTEDVVVAPAQVRVAESGLVAITTTVGLVVVSAPAGTSCDLWLRVPTSWVSGGRVKLFGLLGPARVELASVLLTNVTGTTSGGFLSAVAVTVRGRPADGFEAELYWPETMGTPPAELGELLLQVFDGETPAVVEVTRAPRGGADSPIISRIQPPALVDSGLQAATTTETVVAEAGAGADCDVWVHVPDAWKPDLEVVLYGLLGAARVELGRVGIADTLGTSQSGTFSAIALSARGRQCEGFEVAWRSTSGATLSGTGRAYLQPADVGAAPAITQAGGFPPARQSASVAITTTETVVLTAGPGSGCDVWGRVPSAWVSSQAVVRLYGKVGPSRILLAEGPLTSGPSGGSGGTVDRLPISFRGRSCGGFEVALVWVPGPAGAPSGTGRFFLQPVDEGVAPRPDGLPAPTGASDAPFHARAVVDPKPPTFSAAVSLGLSSSDVTVGYLWKSSSAVAARIVRVRIQAIGNASYTLRVERISAVGTAGSAVTPFRHDASAAPVVDARSGGTTTSTGGVLLELRVQSGLQSEVLWEAHRDADAILLPGGSAGGLRVFGDYGGIGAPSSNTTPYVTFEWTES